MTLFEECGLEALLTFSPILLALVIGGVWWAIRRGGRG